MKIDLRTKTGKEIVSEKKRMMFLVFIIIIAIVLYIYFEHSYTVNFTNTL